MGKQNITFLKNEDEGEPCRSKNVNLGLQVKHLIT